MENCSAHITLRSATSLDKWTLQALYRQTIEHSCAADYDPAQRKAWQQGTENQNRWDEALERQYFLIAEIAGEIAGFGSLEGAGYIDFMYTHHDHLRKGVARLIFRELEIKAKQLGASVLTSDVSKTARPFFEKQGFEIVQQNNNLIRGVWITNFKMVKVLAPG